MAMQKIFKFSILCFFLFFINDVFSQNATFGRTYGGSSYDEGVGALEGTDAYYILSTVASNGPGQTAIQLMKIDTLGNQIWQKTYGGDQINRAAYMTFNFDKSEITIVGFSNSFNSNTGYDTYILNVDLDGDTIFTKTFAWQDWDFPTQIKVLKDSTYLISGYTYSFGKNKQAFLMKIDTNGDSLWCKNYGKNNDDVFNSLGELNDGSLVAAGYTVNNGGFKEAWLFKANANGDSLLSSFFGQATADDYFKDLKVIESHNEIITCGGTKSFGSGGEDVFIVKTNSVGVAFYQHFYGDTQDEHMNSVDIRTFENFAFGGTTRSYGVGSNDFYIVYYEQDYATAGPSYGGVEAETINQIVALNNGYYLAVGVTNSFAPGLSSIYILKTRRNNLDNTVIINNALEQEINNISVFPNPTENQLNIHYQSDKNISNAQIVVYDFLGNQIINIFENFNQNKMMSINTSHLSAGVYMLKIQSENEIIYQSKIIKK
jgi:hypothetical protein